MADKRIQSGAFYRNAPVSASLLGWRGSPMRQASYLSVFTSIPHIPNIAGRSLRLLFTRYNVELPLLAYTRKVINWWLEQCELAMDPVHWLGVSFGHSYGLVRCSLEHTRLLYLELVALVGHRRGRFSSHVGER